MKTFISLSLISAMIIVMSDCAPKTAKKIAKPEQKTEQSSETGSDVRAGEKTKNGDSKEDDVVLISQEGRSNIEQIQLLSQSGDVRLEKGAALYNSSCRQCHDLHNPASRSADGWVEIMKQMGPKAKLDRSSYLMISAYLVKNASK